MARLARLAIDQQLHHLVHRAAPGAAVWFDEVDRAAFTDALLTVSRELGVAIHAHVLLPDRMHLLLTPRRGADISTLMQRLGRRYVGALNVRHGRTGSPWAGRYRSTVLQAEPWLIHAMRLVETSPVLAGLASRADEWSASSAAHHFGRRIDPLVSEHPLYWSLGNTPFEREAVYRGLCEQPLPVSVSTAIRQATDGGWALGEAAFLAALGKQQARRLLPQKRGRPSTVASDPHSDPI